MTIYLDTQDGIVCLEARVSNVSVPLLGLDFDGRSAHAFRVKVSDSDETRSFLQLRPGEPFYVRDLCLTLVSEEQHDQYVELASSGIVPSYEEYSQYVSQMDVESQTPLLSSPANMKRPHVAILETPKRSRLVSSPLAKIIPPGNPQTHIGKREMVDRKEEPIRSSDHNARMKGKLSPVSGSVLTDKYQHNAVGFPKTLESLSVKSGNLVPLEATVPSLRAEIQTKTRESLPIPNPVPADESQDSLAGKIIEVASLTCGSNSQPTPLPMDQAPSFSVPLGNSPNSKTASINASIQVSPANSIEPASSIRSTRSAVQEDFHHLNMQDDGLRVLFSSATTVGDSRVFRKFLTEQGVKIVQDIKDATCFCVGREELKRTTKLILAVLKGIYIVRDTWVTDSARVKELQNIDSYTVKDSLREQEWGMKLEEAIERGRQGIRIFQGRTIVFTPSAKKDLGKTNFSDLQEIALGAGAKSVTMTMPRKGPGPLPSLLFVGTSKDLTLSTSHNWRYYTKDVISLSVLRGNLDEESDEFLIHNEPNANKKRKR